MEYDHKILGQQIAKYRKINGISINMTHLSNIAEILNIRIDDLLVGNLTKCENIKTEKESSYISEISDKLSTFSSKELIIYNRIVNNFLEYKGIKRNTEMETEE